MHIYLYFEKIGDFLRDNSRDYPKKEYDTIRYTKSHERDV